jgi:hypothetical protein
VRLPLERIPRRRAAAAGALGLSAVALAVVVTSGGGEAADAQDAGVPTVELERRDLVARESVDGSLGFAGEADVVNRLTGTFTWLPAEGDVIERGDRLFEVDGDPVLLMYGDVPAYRDLAEGVTDGPDVEQLESNLAELGFDAGGSMTVDDEFTSATADAVADWQDSLGLEETGEVELGRVAFMAGARRVTSLAVALGSDAGSGSGAGDVSGDASNVEFLPVGYTLVDTPAVDPVPGSGAEKKPSGGSGKKPSGGSGGKGGGSGAKGGGSGNAGGAQTGQGSQPAAPAQTAPGGSASTDSGAGSGAGSESAGEAEGSAPSTTVMTTSSERRIVTVDLDPADSGLAERGSTARVELPNGKEVKARVASVGTVAESETDPTTGEASDPTIEVTIALPEGARVTGLDQAPVTVELTDEIRRDVFAVPVEALLGTAGDDYAIVVVDAEGRRQVPVSPGLFADGYVEVEGDGLREGAAVEVPGE